MSITGSPWLSHGSPMAPMVEPLDLDNLTPEETRAVAQVLRELAKLPTPTENDRRASAWLIEAADALDAEVDRL